MAELFDKSCLLVLEGADTHQSAWVWGEIAVAIVHRLGIIKVNLPGSPDKLPSWQTIDMRMSRLDRLGHLTPIDLTSVITETRARYAIEAARRRAWLAQQMDQAIRFVNLTDCGRSTGCRELQGRHGSYLTRIETRPPTTRSFRRVSATAKRTTTLPKPKPVIFGPLVQQLPGDAVDTDWVADISNVLAIDEGLMVASLVRAASGVL